MDKVLLKDNNGVSVPVFMPGTTEVITPSAGSDVTAAVINASYNHIVRIVADADVNIAFAATADANDMLLPSGVVEYYIVPANTKVAAYGTANVYITPHAN